jgi:two-component system chemotaxis response regulator CheB
MTIRVLLVDDSSVVRGLLTRSLEQNPDIQVIAQAADGRIAIVMAKQHRPDIIILDVEMPNMDGLTAIPLLLEVDPGVRILMASKLTRQSASISLQALELGAADYIAKPEVGGLDAFYRELHAKVRALGQKRSAAQTVAPLTPPLERQESRPRVAPTASPVAPPPAEKPKLQPIITPHAIRAIAIASSTGGPQALMTIFAGLKDKPLHVPIFVTQHMPALFTTVLAEHIAAASGFPASEGKDGQVVKPGHIYVAPGDYHMLVARAGKEIVLRVNQDPPVNFCRPAADPMFRSIGEVYGKHVLAAVLTGMGRDGADGAEAIATHGGMVIAQDEETSVVYGMPRVAAERGVCSKILPIQKIAAFILRNC